MASSPTRRFLLTRPQPAEVRITLASEEVRVMKIEDTKRWSKVAASIDALEPVLLEALDAKGNFLRARRPEDDPVDEDLEDEDEEAAAGTSQLETFARLLAEAYRHSTDVAFARMIELVERLSKRGESVEKTAETVMRMQRNMFKEQIRLAKSGKGGSDGDDEKPDDLMQAMMGQFFGGQMRRQAQQAAAAHHANGNGAEAADVETPAEEPADGEGGDDDEEAEEEEDK